MPAPPRIEADVGGMIEAIKEKALAILTSKRRKFFDFLKGLRPPQPWYSPYVGPKGSRWGGWHPRYDDAERLRMAGEVGLA